MSEENVKITDLAKVELVGPNEEKEKKGDSGRDSQEQGGQESAT